MKTIEITLYEFPELSEQAQEKALSRLANINVDHDWWKHLYDDAEAIGLKITEHSEHSITATIQDTERTTAEAIIKNHGDVTNTHKIASAFLKDWDNLVEEHSDGVNKEKVTSENEEEFDGDADDLEEVFVRELSVEYKRMILKEYDYLTSEEVIKETILANEYFFTENGKIHAS